MPNALSLHWRTCLETASSSPVPVTRFAEPKQERGGNAWSQIADDRLCFSGRNVRPRVKVVYYDSVEQTKALARRQI
jgi:hypothetical protein